MNDDWARAKDILIDVSIESGVPVEVLTSPTRTPTVCRVRELAMYRIRNETELSTTETGVLFNREHSTVSIAVQRHIKKLTETENE